jgi:hypothetical protein
VYLHHVNVGSAGDVSKARAVSIFRVNDEDKASICVDVSEPHPLPIFRSDPEDGHSIYFRNVGNTDRVYTEHKSKSIKIDAPIPLRRGTR